MHLAIDLDDVVLDFCGGLRHSVMTEYGIEVKDFTKWEISEVLNPIIGYSWWKWLRQRDWLWPNFPAVPGAIGTLGRLRRDGHYLECLTSKPEWAEFAVWKWLGKWRPPFNRVTIVGPEDRKALFTSAELLVDDRLENCLEFLEADRQAILFDRPHNQDALGVPRAYGDRK